MNASCPLLVPCELSALALGADAPPIDPRPRFADIEDGYCLGRDLNPALFSNPDEASPGPGVHLHWTLPEALRTGEGSPPRLPRVPDRWLVIRYRDTRPEDREIALELRAWVVESDTLVDEDPDASPGDRQGIDWPGPGLEREGQPLVRRLGRVSELPHWRERHPPRLETLTALGYGDPHFALSYARCRGVLGFHDRDAATLPPTELNYLVIGWYARPDQDDPLGQLARDADTEVLRAFLERARWSCPGLQSLFAAMDQSDLLGRRADHLEHHLERLSAARADSEVLDEQRRRLGEARDALVLADAGVADAAVRLPDHLICHASLTGLRWAGAEEINDGGPPLPGSPTTIAIGESAADALSALIDQEHSGGSGDTGGQPLIRVIDAVQHDLIDELAHPRGEARLDRERLRQRFRESSAGSLWALSPGSSEDPASAPARTRVPGDVQAALDDVNRLQRRHDRLHRRRESACQRRYLAHYRRVAVESVEGKQAAKPWRERERRLDLLLEHIDHYLTATAPDSSAGKARRRRLDDWLARVLPDLEPLAGEAPRFLRPKDPALVLAGDALKLPGGDFAANAELRCRLKDQVVTRLSTDTEAGSSTRAKGTDLADKWGGRLPDGGPAIAPRLLEEALLALPADGGRGLAAKRIGQIAERLGLDPVQLSQALERAWHSSEAADDIVELVHDGQIPAPCVHRRWVGQPWRRADQRGPGNPWRPLTLQWRLEWQSTDGPRQIHEGETPLTDAALGALSGRLQAASNASHQSALKAWVQAFASRPQASASLSGFTDQLLTRQVFVEPPPLEPSGGPGSRPVPASQALYQKVNDIPWLAPMDTDYRLLATRAGRLRLRQLRIVDAFGQTFDIASEKGSNEFPVIAAPSLDVKDGKVAFPASLSQAARLVMRWPGRERTQGLCGWVALDRLDDGLMIHAADGEPLGALLASRRRLAEEGMGGQRAPVASFHWVDAPGRASQDPLDPLADPHHDVHHDAHLRGFLRELLGLTDGLGRTFDTLLEILERTAPGKADNAEQQDTTLLVGQPLALIRGRLALELEGPLAKATTLNNDDGTDLDPEIKVRLGDADAAGLPAEDGLVGVFIDDDYAHFYPAWGLSAPQIRKTIAGHPDVAPLDYLRYGHSPALTPSRPLSLTLLVAPQRGMAVDCDVLPRQHVEVPAADLAGLLVHRAFFYCGPLLSPGGRLELPAPSDLYGQWSWHHHPRLQRWESATLHDSAKTRPQSGDGAPRLVEGWLGLETQPLELARFSPEDCDELSKTEAEGSPPCHLLTLAAPVEVEITLSWQLGGALELRLEDDHGSVWLDCRRQPLPVRCRVRLANATTFTLSAIGAAATPQDEPVRLARQLRIAREVLP